MRCCENGSQAEGIEDLTLSGNVVSESPMNKPISDQVTKEKSDLDAKIKALRAFIAPPPTTPPGVAPPKPSPVLSSLSSSEQGRLLRQLEFMAGYSAVLAERLSGE